MKDNMSKNNTIWRLFYTIELVMQIISISGFEKYFVFIIETVRGICKIFTCTYVFVYKVGCELYSRTYSVLQKLALLQ